MRPSAALFFSGTALFVWYSTAAILLACAGSPWAVNVGLVAVGVSLALCMWIVAALDDLS